MIKWPLIGLNGQFGECEKGLIQALNENFFLLDVLVQASFIDFVADEESLPIDPEESDVYILQDTKEIAIYKIDEWVFLQPQQGWGAYIKANNKLYYFNGTDWVQYDANFVVGPSTSTDNAVARFDGTTGKLIQDSLAVLDDAGNLSGIKELTLETLRYLGVGIPLITAGVIPALASFQSNITDNTAGTITDILNPTVASKDGLFIITNKTSNILTFANNTRIVTGLGKDLQIKQNASIFVHYSTADDKWYVVGGAGGGGVGVIVPDWKPAPISGAYLDFDNTNLEERFIFNEVGEAIIATIPVAELWNSQKKLTFFTFSDADGSNKFAFKLTTYLQKSGSPSNILISQNVVSADITAGINIIKSDLTLNSVNGQISGNSVTTSDYVKLKLERVAASVNSTAVTTYVINKSSGVYDV